MTASKAAAYGCPMRKLHLVVLAASALVGFGSLIVTTIPVHADPGMTSITTNAAPAVTSPLPEMPAPESPAPERSASPALDGKAEARHDRLAAYALEVMSGWAPAAASMPVARSEDVARDIAQAVLLEPEGPLPCDLMPSKDGFRRCLWGVEGWNSDHAKVVLLAALAYWEGARYAAYVDEGKCQDGAWRATPEGARLMRMGGDCDHRHAHSLWQIHPVEDRASPVYALCNKDAVDGSRVGAARCALELAGRSLKSVGTLANYTGEFWGEHPKADQRLTFAEKALGKHPFRP